MRAYRCDRCKKHYDRMPEGELMIWKGEEHLDICPRCYRQLDNWLRMRKSNKVNIVEAPELNGGFIFK